MAIARALMLVSVAFAEEELTQTCDDAVLLQTRTVSSAMVQQHSHEVKIGKSPPACAWKKDDDECPDFDLGESFKVGQKNVDACPDGSVVVTTVKACKEAASDAGTTFSGATPDDGVGKCYWCGACENQDFWMSTVKQQPMKWAKWICQKKCPADNIPEHAWTNNENIPSFTMNGFTVLERGESKCPPGLEAVTNAQTCLEAAKFAGFNEVQGLKKKKKGGYKKAKNGDGPCFWAGAGTGKFQMNEDYGSGAKMICTGGCR